MSPQTPPVSWWSKHVLSVDNMQGMFFYPNFGGCYYYFCFFSVLVVLLVSSDVLLVSLRWCIIVIFYASHGALLFSSTTIYYYFEGLSYSTCLFYFTILMCHLLFHFHYSIIYQKKNLYYLKEREITAFACNKIHPLKLSHPSVLTSYNF